MIFQFLEKLQLRLNARLHFSVSDGAIITFNANGKNLPMAWIKAFKTRNKAIPCITGDFSTKLRQVLAV